jgi:hypothetical protein
MLAEAPVLDVPKIASVPDQKPTVVYQPQTPEQRLVSDLDRAVRERGADHVAGAFSVGPDGAECIMALIMTYRGYSENIVRQSFSGVMGELFYGAPYPELDSFAEGSLAQVASTCVRLNDDQTPWGEIRDYAYRTLICPTTQIAA